MEIFKMHEKWVKPETHPQAIMGQIWKVSVSSVMWTMNVFDSNSFRRRGVAEVKLLVELLESLNLEVERDGSKKR